MEVERSKDGATDVEEEESELEQELIAQLKKLRVRDTMKISELRDPIGEEETAQPELTDVEILKRFWRQMRRRKTVKMRYLSQKNLPEPRRLTSFVIPAPCSTYPRKVTKLLIKSFATSSLIFATLPPPKPPSTCGSSSFSLL